MSLLPLPSSKYLPKILTENPDAGTTALTSKIDDHIETWLEEIFGVYWLKSPLRCLSTLLDYLSYMIAAPVFKGDTEAQKRIKIYNAVSQQKIRGTWAAYAKPLFDAITGYSAGIINVRIVKETIAPLWVECDGVINVAGTIWAGETTYGMLECVAGGSVGWGIPGLIYIDCHVGVTGSTLTSSVIEQLVTFMRDEVVPAYFKCYLCYIDAVTGLPVVYSGGIIN
jgi:hypothetical protein